MKKCSISRFRKPLRFLLAMLPLVLFSASLKAQTFYTETFDGTACAAGSGCDPSLVSWTEVALVAAPGNGGAANKFYVSCQEMGNAAGMCGSACASGTGDQSLHIGNVSTSSAAAFFCPAGDCGAAYDDTGAGEATNKRAESPTINCTGQSNITIAFNYMEQGTAPDDPQDDGSLWYFDGTTWSLLNALASTSVAGCAGQGKWTAFSATLPASADGNPNVKIGFVWTNDGDGNATDPSFAVDDITLTSTTTNTITTGSVVGPVCACSTISVPFTSTGTFTAGNTYTAQLSNAAGSFVAPTAIGTLVSTANTGTITCTIPCATPAGSAYRIRVISSTPPITGTDNGVNITVNPVQDSTFAYSGSTFCQSGTNPSPTITGVAGGTFSASPAGLVFVSASTGVINLAASTLGTYAVTYTTPGPCASTMTVPVTITTAPAATFAYSPIAYCQDATNPMPIYSGGGSAGTFTSTAGLVFISALSGEVDLSASTPGIYVVTNTIAPSGGCLASSDTASVIINPIQDSTFSYSASTYCQSGTNPTPTITGVSGGTFTATPAGLVFVSTSTGQIDLAGSTLGTYAITYTTPGPCASSMTVSVTITTAPVSTFSYTPMAYCQNASNPLPAFSGGGSAGAFTSTAGLLFVSASTGEVNLAASTAGIYVVTNTIAASGSCPASSDTATVIINPAQDSTFTYGASTFCQSGTNPTPTITGTSGGTFSASPAGLVFVSTSTGEIDLATSTLGTYAITYTTPGPCAASMTVSVSIVTTPVATFSYTATPYCQNDPNPSPTYSGGGTAGTFTSTAGLVFVSATTGDVDLAASTPGTYTVTNTISTGGCPTTTATATITINPIPTVTVTSATICNGSTANLTASGATSYSWSAGVSPTTGAAVTASPTVTTSYTVTGTDAGCSATAVATVVVNNCNVPVANFSGTPTVMCQPGCANFTDLSTNSPTAWSWSFPGATPASSTSQNPTNVCYSANGVYDVTLIASNASGSDTLTISAYIVVGQPVTVAITGNLLITSCEEAVLTAVPSDGTYVWGPSSTLSGTTGATVTATPPSTQDYYVTYTSPDGCTDSDTVTVTVENINTWFLPTGFTPNGDGINDLCQLHGRGIDYFTLKIYDRIGEKVFETSDIEQGWNGKLHGLPMNDGVFVYVLDITFCNGENVKKHGDITLVK